MGCKGSSKGLHVAGNEGRKHGSAALCARLLNPHPLPPPIPPAPSASASRSKGGHTGGGRTGPGATQRGPGAPRGLGGGCGTRGRRAPHTLPVPLGAKNWGPNYQPVPVAFTTGGKRGAVGYGCPQRPSCIKTMPTPSKKRQGPRDEAVAAQLAPNAPLGRGYCGPRCGEGAIQKIRTCIGPFFYSPMVTWPQLDRWYQP
jgi:hypothetical protein